MNAEELRYLLRRPIAFHRVFADLAGGATGGLFMSQLFYWSDKGADPDGWIYKTQDEWEEETALTRSEQERARKHLRALGILEETRRGVPSRLYYRLNVACLATMLDPASYDARNRQARMQDPPDIPTENTTERDKPRSLEEISAMLRRPGLGRR
jgi:hypothetical protein